MDSCSRWSSCNGLLLVDKERPKADQCGSQIFKDRHLESAEAFFEKVRRCLYCN